MDLSYPLKKIAHYLIKSSDHCTDVYIHSPEESGYDVFFVVLKMIVNNQRPLTSGGVSRDKIGSFIKALVELGETIIVKETSHLTDRSGLAGGLFKKNTIERGKAELIERDAFLYHYRKKIPFEADDTLSELEEKNIKVYRMSSADENYYCYIATTLDCSLGKSECLLIGLGCHPQKEQAISKAMGELFSMQLDHSIRPKWCKKLKEKLYLSHRLPDFHHACSRDIRNRERFKYLCSCRLPRKKRKEIKRNKWIVQNLKSPLKFIFYYKVLHEDLESLEFGVPEAFDGDHSKEGPLYHPIW